MDITESRLVAGGDVGGGDLGFDDAEVATAKATAAVEVLLLDRNIQLMEEQQKMRSILSILFFARLKIFQFHVNENF